MGPDTIIRPSQRRDGLLDSLIEMKPIDDVPELQEAHNIGAAMAANGSLYNKDELSIFSKVVEELFSLRKQFKKQMKNFERELEELKAHEDDADYHKKAFAIEAQISSFDAKQMAMKIAINSLYGASGNGGFRYYDPSIAEGITQSGQLAVRYIGRRISEWLDGWLKTDTGFDRWIYSDTDSCYFCVEDFVNKVAGNKTDFEKSLMIDAIDRFCQKEIEPFIESCYNEMAEYMNAYSNKMVMKREVIADAAIFRAKKNYIIQVYDNEGVRYHTPKLKMMGIETARSTTPDFVKEALIDSYKIMLNGDNDSLLQVMAAFRESYMQQDINMISTPRGVNDMGKWVDANGNYIIRIPYHVKASHEHNRLLAEKGLTDINPIIDGTKVRLITLYERSPIQGNYIAYVGDLPKEFGLHDYIDRETLYDKTFLSPIESFTSILGWKHIDKYDIDDFFS